MGEVRRCHMPAALEAYEDAAWVQRTSREQLVAASRLIRTLEDHKPGSSRLSLSASRSTPSFPPFERRWEPLPPDSPLLASSRSSTALDLKHGVSGFLNLPPASKLPSLVAPNLSPSQQQLHSPSPSLREFFDRGADAVPKQPDWLVPRRGKYGAKLAPARLGRVHLARHAPLLRGRY